APGESGIALGQHRLDRRRELVERLGDIVDLDLVAAEAGQHGRQRLGKTAQAGVSGKTADQRFALCELARGLLDLTGGQEVQSVLLEEWPAGDVLDRFDLVLAAF